MTSASQNVPNFSAEKRRVALYSMMAALAMTLLKLVAGLLSHSLGVLSDAAHSALDLVGATLTFFSVQMSDKPADEDHTYGHGKFENVSSFFEVILMAGSSVWIILEAIRRILHPGKGLENLALPVAVVLCSIGVDYWRSRQLHKVAERTGSPALATDAFHFASDIWSSVAVLGGLGAGWAGIHFGIGWLRYADPLAAVVISLMILRLTLMLGREAVNVLLDKTPVETQRRLVEEVAQVPGVLSVEQARVRRAGANYFADLTLALPRRYTFEHSEDLVEAAKEAVHRVLPEADVLIHTVPRQAKAESIFDHVRAVAARHNVSVHELSVRSYMGRLRVEQHLELDETLPLLEAHNFVTAMEAEILREVPEVDSVLTHIESEPATIEQPEELELVDRQIEQAMRKTASLIPEIADVHEIQVRRLGEHVFVACHCTLPDEMTMQRVHVIITEFEDRFRKECPEIDRVTIHPEPATDNLR
jgi:cation diffusion facilitator family transporter